MMSKESDTVRQPAPDRPMKKFQILRYFRYTPVHLAGLFLVSIAIAGLLAANTYLMKIMYDTVYPGKNEYLLVLVCLVLGGCILLIMVFNILKQFILVRIKYTLIAKLRFSLLEEVTGYEYGYFLKTGSSNIMKRFAEDSEFIAEGMSRAVTGLSNMVVVLLWLIIFLFMIPWVALVYAFVAGFLLAWVIAWRKPHQKSIHAIGVAYERLYRLMWKAIAGIRMVKYELLQRHLYRDLDAAVHDIRHESIRSLTISQAIWSVIYPLPWLAFVLIMYLGYGAIQAGDLTMGALTFCLWFTWRFVEPMAEMNAIVLALHQAVTSKNRIAELLTGTIERGGVLTFTGVANAIEFRGVACRYEGNGFFLEHIDLSLRKGRSLALIGRSGCGKSTIAHLLLRLFDPAEGMIFCDDTPIKEFSIPSIRDRITLVPQDMTLYSTTLRKNIDIRGALSDDEIYALLEKLMLGACCQRLPDGLDTVIAGNGDGFSGGEKQRLGIARALAMRSEIYVFDEITANIDPETERQVLDTIFSLRENLTALFITHNLNLLSRMDDVALIANNTVRLLEPREKDRGIERILALYDIDTGPHGPAVAAAVPPPGKETCGDNVFIPDPDGVFGDFR
jgi:ABC-type multidrug transport system fused ATPase/permease subunit